MHQDISPNKKIKKRGKVNAVAVASLPIIIGSGFSATMRSMWMVFCVWCSLFHVSILSRLIPKWTCGCYLIFGVFFFAFLFFRYGRQTNHDSCAALNEKERQTPLWRPNSLQNMQYFYLCILYAGFMYGFVCRICGIITEITRSRATQT